MLWYKAWLETRMRYLVFLSVLVAICTSFLLHEDGQALSYTKPSYFHYMVFVAHQYLSAMLVLGVTLVAMGGMLREKAVGASSFTLALPVSRSRVAWVRIGTGLIQTLTLAVVPWIAILLVTQAAREPTTIPQALPYLVLLLVGAALFFATAVLISTLVDGEYTAPSVALGILIATGFLFESASLRPYSPWRLMNASDLIDRNTYVLTAPLPWARLTANLCLATLILLTSVKILERREF